MRKDIDAPLLRIVRSYNSTARTKTLSVDRKVEEIASQDTQDPLADAAVVDLD